MIRRSELGQDGVKWQGMSRPDKSTAQGRPYTI